VVNQTRRSRTPFWAVLGGVALLGLIAIAYAANRPKERGVTEVDLRADPAQARGYLLGDSTAPVTVYEFADFECPACMQFATLTEPDVRKRFVDTKQISYRFFDYPLPMHRNTWDASNAAACADEQGKFWPMHDAIYENQDRWNGEATSKPKSVLKELAQGVGVDVAKWEQCYDEDRYRSRIASNRAEAERRRISSTPTFIIGNKIVPAAIGLDEFTRYVNEAKAAATAPATPASATPAATPATTGARQ
jgi:protein-disulfide isomerase